MPNIGTEIQFEDTTIDRLKALGYRYEYGGYVNRPNKQEVALPSPPPEAVQQAVPCPAGAPDETGRGQLCPLA